MSDFQFNIQDVYNNNHFINTNAINKCNISQECGNINIVDNYWMDKNSFHDYLDLQFQLNPGMNESDNMSSVNVIQTIDTSWLVNSRPYKIENPLNHKDLEKRSIGLQQIFNYSLREYMNTYNGHRLSIEQQNKQAKIPTDILDNIEDEQKYQEKMVLYQVEMNQIKDQMAQYGFSTELKHAVKEELTGKLKLIQGNNDAEILKYTYTGSKLYYTQQAYDKNSVIQKCSMLAKKGYHGTTYDDGNIVSRFPSKNTSSSIDRVGEPILDPDIVCKAQLNSNYNYIPFQEDDNDFKYGDPNYLCCASGAEQHAEIVTYQGYNFYQPDKSIPRYYLIGDMNYPRSKSVMINGNYINMYRELGYVGENKPPQGDPDSIGLELDEYGNVMIYNYPLLLKDHPYVLKSSATTDIKESDTIYEVSFSIYVLRVNKTFQQMTGLSGGYNPLQDGIGVGSGFGSNSNLNQSNKPISQDFFQPLQIVIDYKDHVQPPIVFPKTRQIIGNASETQKQLSDGFKFINRVLCGKNKVNSNKNKKIYDNMSVHKYNSLLLYHPQTDKYQISEDFPYFRKDNYF